MVHLDRRNIRHSLARKWIDSVIHQSRLVGCGKKGLNLQSDRIHTVPWNGVVRERIANQVSSIRSQSGCRWIVYRSFRQGPSNWIAVLIVYRANITARQGLTEIAVTICLTRNSVRDRVDHLLVAVLFEVEKEERPVVAVVDFPKIDRSAD